MANYVKWKNLTKTDQILTQKFFLSFQIRKILDFFSCCATLYNLNMQLLYLLQYSDKELEQNRLPCGSTLVGTARELWAVN